MEEKLNQLKAILAEISDLNAASALMGWDQQVYMPQGGAGARGTQLATLQKLIHQKSISPEIGQLLEDLSAEIADLDPDSDEARLIKVAKRDYERAVKVPPSFTAEFAKVTSDAFGAWMEARSSDNFSKFQPHLEKIVDLGKQYVEFFAPYEHVYDPLLDMFEPGMKTADVRAIFDAMRPKQVALIQEIGNQPQVDDAFLHKKFDEQKQWDFGVSVITKFGYDWNRGRQDKSAHPFTTNFSRDDVRITTRFEVDYLGSALFSTMHEGGHALYEQGSSPKYERSPLAGGASLAVHESQSRMFENLIGRSMPFWEHFYPQLQDTFSAQLGNVDLQTFYKGINKVEPSLIRVEADEATYNLHIMLRLELEIALMEGTLAVADLPEAWNARMEEYLGLTPPNDADGVLQDVHWSGGMIGYFSTYALGNLVSVQLWEKMNADMPNMEDQIRKGKFGDLLNWLVENVHQHGRKYEPQ
ncbi:MAG TPA: carboxypeptidase M32, partial [Anaerolineales bacterium]|nr:carboxypeptidase M32 [Anaerolineales bacterium]